MKRPTENSRANTLSFMTTLAEWSKEGYRNGTRDLPIAIPRGRPQDHLVVNFFAKGTNMATNLYHS